MTLVERLQREVKRLDWKVKKSTNSGWTYDQEAADQRELLEEVLVLTRMPLEPKQLSVEMYEHLRKHGYV